MPTVKVSELGEFELIARLARVFEDNYRPKNEDASRFNLMLGIGDDAAVWQSPPGLTVFTCDAMVCGSHFDLSYSQPEDVGWRSMVSCQSDVAAMGFMPRYSTITLGLRGNETCDLIDRIYVGMAKACSQFGGRVVGGDVVRSETMFISVAMVGSGPATDHRQVTRPMMRSAAQQGDVIAVTGPLGNSAGGLKLLMSNRSVQDSATTMLMDAHRRPEPMVRAGIWLAANGIRCAVDISDGLIDDLTRICIASGVGAKLQLSKLPVDPELKSIFPDKWRDMALGGGEGYQLAFTIPTNVLKEIQNSTEIPVIEIGQIIAGDPKVILLDSAGTEVTLCSTGFEHFTS